MKIHNAANILFALAITGLWLTTLGIGVALAAGCQLPWLRLLGIYIVMLHAAIIGAVIARAFDPTRKP